VRRPHNEAERFVPATWAWSPSHAFPAQATQRLTVQPRATLGSAIAMGHGLLAYLNPAKALTAFSCWWLQIDAGVARKLRAEARAQCEATVVQVGKLGVASRCSRRLLQLIDSDCCGHTERAYL